MAVLPILRQRDTTVISWSCAQSCPVLMDTQLCPPAGMCARCGGELYWYDEGELCPVCREGLGKQDGDT